MDWKDILSQKIESGHLEREEFTAPDEKPETPQPALLVELDRKGRRGKTATIVSGFNCPESELKSIASALQKKLGTGGSARGSEILIQGDRVADTREALRAMGHRVK